jgi:hypothetical protein
MRTRMTNDDRAIALKGRATEGFVRPFHTERTATGRLLSGLRPLTLISLIKSVDTT